LLKVRTLSVLLTRSAGSGILNFGESTNEEEAGRDIMWLIIGIVLVVLWLGGFLVFHTAGFLIHILLILAVISIVFHFLRGGSRV
jgi:hypothetical protein